MIAAASAFAQTNPPVSSSTYRLPTVTVYGAQPDSTQSVAQAANSVTVLSGEQVRPGGIANTRELGTYLPNVTVFDANNDRSPKFSVRGLRENNFATGDPAIGFYVDDIPYTDLNSRGLALFDVEQIEFLRGPQPGLFGANGPGGVINIVTRQPSDELEGRGSVTLGNYDQQIYEASLRGPIVAEKLSLGLSGLFSRREGFVHNDFLDTHPDDKETLAGRAQLRWTPSESWDFSLVLHGQKFNDGFVPTYYRGHDKDLFSVKRDFDGYVDTETWGTAFKGSFENEAVKVTSVTSYRNWRQDLLQDFDFTEMRVRLGFAKPELDQWSQELRVQSNDETQDLKWLGGLYFSDSRLENETGSVELLVPPPFPNRIRTFSETEANTYAAFGQATYTVWDKLDLTAGLRFTYDNRSLARDRRNPFHPAPRVIYDTEDHFTDVSPKFGITYHCADNIETYASISRGYQSGGFNTSNDSEAGAKFNPSHSWHYEIGSKTRWLEERFFVNAALFYTDFENYQVYRINNLDPSTAYLVNADSVRSYGAELDMTVRPCQYLDLSAAFGVTKTEFDDFTDPNNAQNFDGNDVNFVPDFTASFAAQLNLPCNFYARAEYQAVGNYYLDEANSAKQTAYGLVNARIGYQQEHFEIYVFGRNIFNKEYVNNALDLRNSNPGFADQLIRQPGDPMTFGIALAGKF